MFKLCGRHGSDVLLALIRQVKNSRGLQTIQKKQFNFTAKLQRVPFLKLNINWHTVHEHIKNQFEKK